MKKGTPVVTPSHGPGTVVQVRRGAMVDVRVAGGQRVRIAADRLKRENGMAGRRRNSGKNEGRATIQWTHNMDRYVYLSPMERRSKDGLGAVLVWDKAQTLWKLSIMMPDGTFYEDVLSRSVAFGDRQKALDIATEMVMNTAILHLGG